MKVPPRLLLVEDSYSDAELAKLALRSASFPNHQIDRVGSLREAQARLGERVFDAIMLDLTLPDGVGVALVKKVHQAAPQTPIVVLTSLNDERLALACIDAGAHDFVSKSDLHGSRSLARALSFAMRRGPSVERHVGAMTERKAHFVAVMSHELRTPLGAIVNYVQLMEEGIYGVLIGDQKKAIDGIRTCATQLQTMVDEILDLSKIEAGHSDLAREYVELGVVCAEVVETTLVMARATGVTLNVDVPPDLPLALTDARKLRQVLLNLTTNAVKYTEGGIVDLQVRQTDGGLVSFAVSDNGVGIAPEQLSQIFHPFHRADIAHHARGYGLGLCIAERLAHAIGASISVESTRGEGSIFTVWLPVTRPAELGHVDAFGGA